MGNDNLNCYDELVSQLINIINDVYWEKMYKYINDNNIDYKDINCFILNPENIVVYLSRKFIAIEYCGNQYIKNCVGAKEKTVFINDYTNQDLTSKQFIEKIVGFHFDDASGCDINLQSGIYEDLIIPTNSGFDKMIDLKWNLCAQSGMISFNTSGLSIEDGCFSRLINCMFFDAQNDDLKTRIIKWIDFIPCYYEELEYGTEDKIHFNISLYNKLWKDDLFYQYEEIPDFKYEKLLRVNRFIELFGNSKNLETDITSFLSLQENKFILNMGFMGTKIEPQLKCEWQSEEKDKIIPDFFVVRANGYADIIEFKLPKIKGNSVVGRNNREQFSAEINSYIAQTRVYSTYFDDPNNRRWFENKYGFKVFKPRRWFENKYGFKVFKPKRYLVVGRRNDFKHDEWMAIKSDYTNIEIVTYDDLVDTVICQFYQ